VRTSGGATHWKLVPAPHGLACAPLVELDRSGHHAGPLDVHAVPEGVAALSDELCFAVCP